MMRRALRVLRVPLVLILCIYLYCMWILSANGNFVRIRRISDGSIVQSKRSHLSTVLSVVCSSDGKYVASGDSDQIIYWQISSKGGLHKLRVFRRPSGNDGISIALSSRNGLLAAGCSNCVVLWKTQTGNLVAKVDHGIGWRTPVSFSPDGNLLAISGAKNDIKFLQLPSARTVRSVKEGNYAIYSLAFSPDGRYLASGGENGMVRIWRVSDGKYLLGLGLRANKTIVRSVIFSPNSRLLASAHGDRIIFWEIPSGRLVRVLGGNTTNNLNDGFYTSSVTSLAFSPDGKLLAASGTNPAILRVSDGKLLQLIPNSSMNRVYCVAFSPNGKYLITGEWRGPHH